MYMTLVVLSLSSAVSVWCEEYTLVTLLLSITYYPF